MWLEARLRAFAAVARQGSFSRAAEELFLSQPAVSKHVAALERDVGATLFLRRPRGAALTPAGTLLADYVARAEGLLAQARRGLAALAGTEPGVLSLAASGNPGNYLLPALIARFLDENPLVELAFELGNSHDVEDAVRRHRVELGVVGGAAALPELETEPLLEDELILVGAPSLANRPLGKAELERERWIFREEGSATRSIADEARRQLGVTIRSRLELPSWEAIKQAAVDRVGVAACSRFAVEAELAAGALVELDVPRWEVRRLISAVWARGVPLTPPAERFLELLRAEWRTARKPLPRSLRRSRVTGRQTATEALGDDRAER